MTTLIIGGSGLLGQALVDEFSDTIHATYHSNPPVAEVWRNANWLPLDITDEAATAAAIETIKPDLVVNAAYVSAGPGLEAITAHAPGTIAGVCRRASCRLVHVSTDVVFGGDRTEPYAEADDPDPVHAYGRAKLSAERAVTAADPAALIVRTSLLYGGRSEHAQETLIRRAVEKGDITFFTDEVRCPIAVTDLAGAIRQLSNY
ncbi:MAG: sugar nucleotide-binding protein, partial [Acidimicrobiales bacterium]|nr:sugar nucleotide-binding protein [Acidimicrobiales bacterium]